MKCKDCGAEMKPLAFSVYCPNDCDRPKAEPLHIIPGVPTRNTHYIDLGDFVDEEKTPTLGPAGSVFGMGPIAPLHTDEDSTDDAALDDWISDLELQGIRGVR